MQRALFSRLCFLLRLRLERRLRLGRRLVLLGAHTTKSEEEGASNVKPSSSYHHASPAPYLGLN